MQKTKSLTAVRILAGPPADTADIQYLTGFRAPDPAILLVAGDGRHLVVSDLECGRARRSRAEVVHTLRELGGGRPVRLLDAGILWLKKRRIRRVEVSELFPGGWRERLEKEGIRTATIAGATCPARARKTADEVAAIRRSQRAAVAAYREAARILRASEIGRAGRLRWEGAALTSERLRQAIEAALARHDCEGGETIVAGGPSGADPHERGRGPLRAGEPIVLDIFPRHRRSGYWGDLTRTLVKGVPPPELRRMYAAVAAAHRAALARTRPGAAVRAIHRAAQAALRAHGFENRDTPEGPEGFIHGTGHGVGLDIHEAPRIADTDGRLAAGNVVTIEPGLYYRRIGGVRIEDTVAVTAHGAEILCPCPYRWIVP